MSNQLQTILDDQQVAQDNAKQLIEAFGAPFEEAGEILKSYQTIVVKDESDTETMQQARTKRLALKAVRTSVEAKRKELKSDIVKAGRAIDSVARFVKETIEPAEKYLETQEKFAEIKAAERAATKRAERLESLAARKADPALYNIDAMDDDQFASLIDKLDAEIQAAKEAAERAEAERLAAEKAELERQASIIAENKQLRQQEAEQRAINERKLARVNQVTSLGMLWSESLQAYKLDDFIVTTQQILELNDVKWRILISDTERVVNERRAAAEAARKAEEAEREAELQKQRQQAEAERKRREELEQQEAERKAAEEQVRRDAEEAKRQALLAPDKEKIVAFSSKINELRTIAPVVESVQAKELLSQIDSALAGLSEKIIAKSKQL